MSLDAAIAGLQAEINALGTPIANPSLADAPADWYTVRAKSLALSMLKAAKVRGATSPADLESYRRQCRQYFVNELGPG